MKTGTTINYWMTLLGVLGLSLFIAAACNESGDADGDDSAGDTDTDSDTDADTDADTDSDADTEDASGCENAYYGTAFEECVSWEAYAAVICPGGDMGAYNEYQACYDNCFDMDSELTGMGCDAFNDCVASCSPQECTPTEISRLCVTQGGGTYTEGLVAGVPLKVMAFPAGCFSSSATVQVETICNPQATNTGWDLDAGFCLGDDGSGNSTPDCGGGGTTSCELSANPTEGSYVLNGPAGLTLNFEIPSDGNEFCVDIETP